MKTTTILNNVRGFKRPRPRYGLYLAILGALWLLVYAMTGAVSNALETQRQYEDVNR